MRKRCFKAGLYTFGLAGLGILYYFWGKYTGIYIPCFFRLVTGLYCPGCGATRMAAALGEGDLYRAFHSNEALFVLLPFFASAFIGYLRRYILGIRRGPSKWEKVITGVALAGVILFGILRNIPYFYYLRP